jgi:sigma-E factor negative regulatory protein RseA
MTDRLCEQISAFLDGQLPAGEASLLVRRLERDPELRRVFGNYVLAGEVLAAPGGVTASPGFAARVAAAIDASPAEAIEPVTVRPSRHAPRWTRPAVATALAASAALAAVLLVRPDMREAQTLTADGGNVGTAGIAAFPIVQSSPTPAQSQRLAGYLVSHSQFANPMGRRNVWSGVLAADPGIARVPVEVDEGH